MKCLLERERLDKECFWGAFIYYIWVWHVSWVKHTVSWSNHQKKLKISCLLFFSMVFSDVKVRYKFLLFPSLTKRTYTTIFIRFNAESSLGSHSKLSRDPVARTYAAIPNPEDRWPPRLHSTAWHRLCFLQEISVCGLPNSTFSEHVKPLNLECCQVKGY